MGKKRYTKHCSGGGSRTRSSGPRLPSAFRKQLDNFVNPDSRRDKDDEAVDSDEAELNYGIDVYEYEEEIAEEESKKNRRYDHVDSYEYELPETFKDEDIFSEDDDEDDAEHGQEGEDYGEGEDDDGRHKRMLQEITGMPAEVFEGKKKRQNAVVSEAYPESEFNPSCDVLSGNGEISIEDLLDPLRGTSNYSKLRKRIQHVEKKEAPVQAPLPKPERERVERGVAYDYTKKDITKWEPLIKRNREAPTIYFDKSVDLGFSTVGAIASEFKPRTDFEKTIASLVHDNDVVEAYKSDGGKLLELNKLSVEEVKDRQNRLAKMRSLLFCHEMKAKHIKKIKSKTYRRLKKKERMKAASLELQRDHKAAKELAEKQERERAEARMTLRHKNQGKWAKRILERGLDKQDEGTRAAISEQLHMHNLLTRKMNSMKDSSSSDDSSYEEDDDFDSEDEDGASKLLEKAKEKTIKLMDQEDEVPDSGVLSLPFMVRGLEKRKEAANEEAKRALEEYGSSLKQRASKAAKGQEDGTSSGRRVFGAPQKQTEQANFKQRSDVDNYGSDSEDIIEENDSADAGHVKHNNSQKDVNIDLDVLCEGLDSRHDSVFKSIEDVVDNPGPRTTYEVSVFASGSWKKMKSKGKADPMLDGSAKNKPGAAEPSVDNHIGEEVDEDSDTDSGGQMIDGVLSSGTKQTYELPTNEELIRRAFAGDKVEVEFEKDKEEVLNEENPEPEKPLVLPGWGQWTDVQKKRGTPSWMLEGCANAKRKREEAIKKRKDAGLKHVIISEKVDKKAEKLHVKTLPYPFTSKEVYEQSIRMPIGPESNPAITARALTRPEVVKKAGVIIDPIKFEEVDPHERGEEQKQGGRRRRGKTKASANKSRDSKRT
ncbi:hypothetical protein Cgig2_007016 [Carnegiea gigantea]|uniref:U3 small nucleolar RNA-associated protein 14 n=1 Tax=Carnegiea gigantea TaxID=171969 RepID=A0A9Q1QF45_9CARY|nr:hypothetical protein Cgig2_007016 [Carnegiea gigantea]